MTLASDLRAALLAGNCGAIDDDPLTGFCDAIASVIEPYVSAAVVSKETGLLVVTASAAISGGTVTLTYAADVKAIVLVLDTAVTTLAIVPFVSAANRATNLNLTIVHDGGSIAGWSGVEWIDGTPPELSASGVDLLAAMYDGSTTTARFVASPGFTA